MHIKKIVTGIYAANCYIIHDGSSKKALVIDPGGSVDEIVRYLKTHELEVEKIVLTHGHVDHIGGADELRRITGADILIHEQDAYMIRDAARNLSKMTGDKTIRFSEDYTLSDRDLLEIGSLKALVIHTPGHSAGGICLKIGEVLFSGDTLFKGSIGRTDLHKGSFESLMSSIMDKLMVLPDDTKVYPGHGPWTSIGYERQYNSFVLQARK